MAFGFLRVFRLIPLRLALGLFLLWLLVVARLVSLLFLILARIVSGFGGALVC